MFCECMCVSYKIDVFVYYGGNGYKFNKAKCEEYGVSYGKTGDIISIKMDLQNMLLFFIVNGNNQGIAAHLNKDKMYHFVLNMRNKNDSICVMSQQIVRQCQTIPKTLRHTG